MVRTVEKVTAFITRQTKDGHQLLLLDHPNAGIQIPAGTVEAGETPDQAVLREVSEETGLTISSPSAYLGCQQTPLPFDQAIILPPATVFARPDLTSFDWIRIRSAVQVKVLQTMPEFTQITYIEYDQVPEPNFISMQITGWVPNEYLAQKRQRHFFYLKFEGDTPPRWDIFSDHHTFRLFWSHLDELPSIIPPQDAWLRYLTGYFNEEE
jgi:8-oxo-dGTP pyrophosphatase MutT (NUDIX family)